ncbi:hypothetical protein BH09PSE5_BH09PSE5_15310 [soil metagenome]
MKKHSIAAAVMAASLLGATVGAHAQGTAAPATTPAPAAAPSSPAKKALIQKLLTLQQPGIEAVARSLAEQPIADMMQPVRQLLQTRVAADQREATGKAIEGDVKKYLDEAVPLLRDRAVKLAPTTIGTALDQKFSEDELKQLVNWFESAVSKKYQQAFPELQAALVQQLINETRQPIEARLRALDQSIGQKLGLPAPGAQGAAPAAPPSSGTR